MENKIIGRSDEKKLLQDIYDSAEPQFLAVYGRRRIGKTFLIAEFFEDKGLYFEITGMQGGSTAEQLLQFAYEFSRQFTDGNRISPPKNWTEGLNRLHDAIEKVEEGKKIILFFDEVPWIATPRSHFLDALEHFWNRYLSRKKNVILIICGSSASWVIRNIINNKGGLHGRVTRKIRLLPFSLDETEKYLQSRQVVLDRKQIIDIYMAIGGVPKYLSYVSKGKSAAQVINDVCFVRTGGLYDEFNNLYRSLFETYEHHIAIVKVLAKARGGLTKDELLKRTKLSSGGASSRVLEDLVDAGFLAYMPAFNKKKVGGTYRLIDEYSLFYLDWIEENTKIGIENVDPEFWIKKQHTPKWKEWSGRAFEALCLKHIQKIKKTLGISGMSTVESGWRYIPEKGSALQGAQIDLVIDRADRCMNLCEMKYTDTPFVIDKQYGDKLQNKKRVFREQTGTRKTLFTTMVTTYGVEKNTHYLSSVDNQLTMDDLF